MVLCKRLDYGFNGYQVPSLPQGSRSPRARNLFKMKVDETQMSPFELLATVAENLLQERESRESPNAVAVERVQPLIVKEFLRQEEQDGEKHLNPCNKGSCDKRVYVSDYRLHVHSPNNNFMGPPLPKHDMDLDHFSIIADSSFSEKADHSGVATGRKRNEFMKLLLKVEGYSHGYGESCSNLVGGIEGQLESDRKLNNVIKTPLQDSCSPESPMELDVKPPTLVSLNSSTEVPYTSFVPFQTDTKLVCKDDDENFSGCTHPSTGNLKAFRPPPRIGDRRIRRLLASKYWKIPPKSNHRKLSSSDTRLVYQSRKACYMRLRLQRDFVSRRKHFESKLISRSKERTPSDFLSTFSKINKETDSSSSRAPVLAAQESSIHSRESRVKLSIKSFRVPELFIEIPETATVGSLKRTVREAVTAILAGGLCVGVVLEGQTVRDDDKTLLQTGISHDYKLDGLGFMLEPTPAPAPAPAPALISETPCQEGPPVFMSYGIPQTLARYPKALSGYSVPSVSFSSPALTDGHTYVGNGLDLIPSPTDMTVERAALDSRVLIAGPMSVEPLTAVPLYRKSRQSDLCQRRIRRPFSVSEVEALVEAVEKLGTGRWRDVKHYAFESVKHRTYVDLKDKWKTLVHTAKISPRQRRGHPVPQALLDRVLDAHAHWSQQQDKQTPKPVFTSYNLIEQEADQMGDS